ncbi:hypothetical protein PHYSODRAFT_445766, partial [Phytophthora sojae]
MPGNTMEDTCVISLGEIDNVMVFTNNLRDDRITIPKSMVAMIDLSLFANSIKRISEITFLRMSALLLIA